MSEIRWKLTSCTHISEWVTPQDNRLEEIAGRPVPQAGAILRDPWELDGREEEQVVAQRVRQLLVPHCLQLRGEVNERFNNHLFVDRLDLGLGAGNVEIVFTERRDWEKCFPVSEATAIFNRDGMQAWAAIALCQRTVGLSVFAMEEAGGAVRARIQIVPDEALQQM